MTLELDGQKTVVTDGKRELDREIADAVATWSSGCVIGPGDVDKLKQLLPIAAQMMPERPNRTSSLTSLRRDTIGHENLTGGARLELRSQRQLPKILGIKSRGIGRDGCKVIRQALTTNH